MNAEDNTALIEQYLLGKLAGEQLRLVEVRLRLDEHFRREVEVQRILMREVERAGRAELRERLQCLEAKFSEPSEIPSKGENPKPAIIISPGRSFGYYLFLLFVLLLLAGLIYLCS